jgi:ABC-type nickel/cobalt efflux system permease component RcnA
MHFTSISLTLLVLLLGLFFMGKTKTEYNSWFYRLMAMFIVAVAGILLIVQLWSGCSRFYHNRMHKGNQHGMMHYQNQKMHRSGDRGGCGMADCNMADCDMTNCDMTECDMADCDNMAACGMAGRGMHRGKKMKLRKRMLEGAGDTLKESSVDTVNGKIIKREIEIIKQ